MLKRISGSRAVLLLCIALVPALATPSFAVKRVILMIGDGMGFKHLEATRNYVGSSLVMESLPVKLAATTYEYGGSYNSSSAWSDFNYVLNAPTDSASAATALSCGVKVDNGNIATDHNDVNRLATTTEIARARGLSPGVISTVPFSHATPAAFAAHNNDRNNYAAIAREMITSYGDGIGARGNTPTCQVVIGGGHPTWDGSFMAAAEYNALVGGTTGQGWSFVQRVVGVNGSTSLTNAAASDTKLFGLYGGPGGNLPYRYANGSGANAENPTLAVMSTAALTVLNRDTDGFFLMIEGGAIDWASHGNNIDLAIGEVIDYDNAVSAVVNWVNAVDPSWNDTLLIVTADHETGYITRASGSFPNVALANPGTGVLPVPGTHFWWNTTNHSNSLVPVFAKGAGSALLTSYATQWDSGFAKYYLDNLNICQTVLSAVTSDTLPPANVTGFVASPGSTFVQLRWTNPSDSDFTGTMIRWKAGSDPTSPTDGSLVADTSASPGSADYYVHTGLTNGSTYYYKAFAHDGVLNYASGATATATPLATAVSTINVKPAGAITIDGSSADWSLSDFTTKSLGGQSTTGDIAVVGFDSGSCYRGAYVSALPTSAADHAAKIYSRHDALYLYFLVRCDDSDIRYSSPVGSNWANDCVEFYLDPSHNHGSSPISASTSDCQLVIDANNQKNVYMTTSDYATRLLAGVTSAVVRDGTGWTAEVRIAKSALDPDLPVGGSFGLDFNFRDNDNNNDPALTTVYTWNEWSTSGFPSKTPDHWGNAALADTTPPVISSVVVDPSMAAAGDSVHVVVDVTDNVGVAGVTANGAPLAFSSGNTWSGDIAANSALGLHTVTVVASDAANNTATDSSQSYKTVRIVAIRNDQLAGLTASWPLANYLFLTWGWVTDVQSGAFDLAEFPGSPISIHVTAPGHGLLEGNYAYARGIWQIGTPPYYLSSSAAHVGKLK